MLNPKSIEQAGYPCMQIVDYEDNKGQKMSEFTTIRKESDIEKADSVVEVLRDKLKLKIISIGIYSLS